MKEHPELLEVVGWVHFTCSAKSKAQLALYLGPRPRSFCLVRLTS